MACVDLPDFALQLLLKDHPDWRSHPSAVVDRDHPQGKILCADERARSAGILPGMRCAAALALAGGLRAGVVEHAALAAALRAVTEELQRFTPCVEPAEGEPGIFWLDARGLERLHPSLEGWAKAVHEALRRKGFRATVAAGSSRFGTYTLARTGRGVVVFDDPAAERAAAARAPLDRLPLDPPVRDALLKLGVATLGQFLELPPEGLAARFGPEVHRLHRLAAGELVIPLAAAEPLVPISESVILEPPETDAERLLNVIEDLLRRLLDKLSRKAAALAGLRVAFRFDRLGEHLEIVRPAAPTLDLETLLQLVRLRMEAARSLPDEVARVDLTAEPAPPAARQLQVLVQDGPAPRRDPLAAERALARVRARLGDKAVARARLREGHLPEGRFEWVPFETLPPAAPRGTGGPGLVRRLEVRPVPLPPRRNHEPDGWMLRGLEQGPVVKVTGPFIVSGGWWNRPVHREYHFAETQRGEIFWVYYDRPRRRWYLHGRVE